MSPRSDAVKLRLISIRIREAKQIADDFSSKLKAHFPRLSEAKRYEACDVDGRTLIFVDGAPLIIREGEQLLPTLIFAEAIAGLPRITVDMGAVPHLCNGADVMAPGLRKIEGAFSVGDIIVVVDERFGKPITLGNALMSSDAMKDAKHGKIVKNLHYVGDPVWNALKPQTS